MTEFDPNVDIGDPDSQYEHDLFSRILKNIHKVPKENYPGLVHTFGIPLIKLFPEPMLLNLLRQTKKHPKGKLLPY